MGPPKNDETNPISHAPNRRICLCGIRMAATLTFSHLPKNWVRLGFNSGFRHLLFRA